MHVDDAITSRKSARRCLPPTGRELLACVFAPGHEDTRALGNAFPAERAAVADLTTFHGFESA